MNRLCKFSMAAAAIAIMVGCVRMPAGVSPSNTPLGTRSYKVVGEAYGSSTSVAFLGFLPVSSPNYTYEAIENAKQTSGGDALIDVTIEGTGKYFILFSTYTTEVRGKAIKFTQADPNSIVATTGLPRP